MTLQQLLYFLTTAERGSFNAAARTLHCSQPAVSEQVRRLEDELGVALFARKGRGLALTSAGRTFRGHAERTLAAADDAASSVGRRSFRREQIVTIGVFRNAPYYLIAELVAAFHAANPQIRLRLPGENSAEVAAAVQSGELEAGLVVLPVDDRGLEIRTLFRDDVLFISRDPRRVRQPMTIERLVEAPLVLYDARYGFDDPTRRQLAMRAQEAGLTLSPRFDVEHFETAMQLASRGLGDTIAARSLTLVDWFPSVLGAVPFARPLYDTFSLVTRRGATLSTGTRLLVDAVEAWAYDVGGRLADAAEA